VSEEILFRVEGEYIPVAFSAKVEEGNPKRTRAEAVVYTGLIIKQFKHPYLIAMSKKADVSWRQGTLEFTTTAMVGSVIYVSYETGSWKNVYQSFVMYLLATHADETSTTIQAVNVTLKNLQPLEKPDKMTLAELEAEIRNKGWMLSKYDPVRTLYHYFLKSRASAAPDTSSPTRIESAMKELGKL
jgi:hypothetical protein